MTAYDRLVERLGSRPEIQCWSPTQYRVTVPGWHYHSGAVSGRPCGDGKTLEAACESFLRQMGLPHVELVEGGCTLQCENRYSDSDKAKTAHRLLCEHIERAAEQVSRWPAWKRGLPPCPTDNCEMAVGHPGECE